MKIFFFNLHVLSFKCLLSFQNSVLLYNVLLYWSVFPDAALTNHYNLVAQEKSRNFFLHSSGGRKSEISITGTNEGVIRATLSLEPLGGDLSLASSSVCWLLALLGWWLPTFQSLPPWSHHLLFCLSNLLPPFYKDTCDCIYDSP